MIKGKFYTNDGELIFINGTDDLKKLINEQIGFEAAQMFQEVVNAADEVKQRLESELSSYEASLDASNAAMREIKDAVMELEALISQSKIDRKAVQAKLDHIIREIANQW
jgi:chromosome segregation ATPase